MKACVFEQHGGVDQLHIADLPAPRPAADEVLIRVRAVALNGFDPMMLAGSTKLKVPFPMAPCGDFAGEIIERGDAVDPRWQVGQRVSGYPILPGKGMMGEVTMGAACEVVAIPQQNLVTLPDGLSFEHAAALPVAYGTAYRMMTMRGQVKAGERVLILGATGGVGVACLQLAKAVGAEVTACGGGVWKGEKLREIGADHVIDTSKDDFLSAARDLVGKPSYDGSSDGGYDVVVNYIGGDTYAKSLKLIKRYGRILVCGATAGYDPQTDLRYIWSFEQSVIGSNGWTVEDQQTLMEMAADGRLVPVIHAVRPVEEMATAMQELTERNVFGKSVLTL